MPIYTSGWRRGIPAPLRRGGATGPRSMHYWFGEPCDSSERTVISLPRVGHVPVHRRVADAFLAVFGEIEDAGLLNLIDRSDFGGTYCCRRVRGGRSYSPHSWAVAIDLNVHHLQGPQGEYRSRSRINWRCAEHEIPQSLRRLWPYFLRWGFTWGGIWRSFKDPMHFEATELTVALLEGRDLPYMQQFREAVERLTRQAAGPPPVKLCTPAGQLITDQVYIRNGRAWMPVRALENMGYTVTADHLPTQRKIYVVHRPERGGV